MYTYKELHPLRYWCHKILPLVYDDSLSYYEVLCKLSKKLNELIENNNELQEKMVELDDAFTNVEARMNERFNLLYQYIDEKLNEYETRTTENLETWKDGTEEGIELWKESTIETIESWKESVQDDLATWKTVVKNELSTGLIERFQELSELLSTNILNWEGDSYQNLLSYIDSQLPQSYISKDGTEVKTSGTGVDINGNAIRYNGNEVSLFNFAFQGKKTMKVDHITTSGNQPDSYGIQTSGYAYTADKEIVYLFGGEVDLDFSASGTGTSQAFVIYTNIVLNPREEVFSISNGCHTYYHYNAGHSGPYDTELGGSDIIVNKDGRVGFRVHNEYLAQVKHITVMMPNGLTIIDKPGISS